MNQKYISLDCETHDPHLIDKGPSWVFSEGEILVTGLYDVAKQKKGYIDGNGGKTVGGYLSSASVCVIGANIQYDIGWLAYEHKMKISDIKCELIDVAVAESFIDEYQDFSLDSLAIKYLNEEKGVGDLPGICASLGLKGDFRKHLHTLWYWKDEKLRKEYRDQIRKYVISDADQPARIWELQKKILEEQGLMPAFTMNMKMVKVCLKMKQRGVRIDYERWQHNCYEADKIHGELARQFHAKYGEVNIRSNKQMGDFMKKNNVPFKWRITVRGWEPEGRKFKVKTDLFRGHHVSDQRRRLKEDFPGIRIEKDRLKIYIDAVYLARTCKQLEEMGYNIVATPNIDKYFFKETQGSYKVVADLMQYKQVKDIISKFLGEKFGRFLVYHKDTKEWRLHGNFNVVGARQTGRLSANAPNLQNIPSKTVLFEGTSYEVDLSIMCREIFLPEKGHIFAKLDFSGQENRLQAHFAFGRSGNRIRAMYNENPRLDEHQFVATASGLEEEYGKKLGRKYAKNVRFGLSYGMQQTRMCLQFGWAREFAQELSDKVKDASPWFIETMEEVQETVKERGYIRTIAGRRVHLHNWEFMGRKERQEAKVYQFYNYLIQGSAADQTKACTVACDETETLELLLLSVHDEGDFSLPMTKEGLARLKELKRLFEEAMTLDVPVICDPELGMNWAYTEGQELDDKGFPIETLDSLWKRAVSSVKAGKRGKPRVFDLEDLQENEEEEDDDDDS